MGKFWFLTLYLSLVQNLDCPSKMDYSDGYCDAENNNEKCQWDGGDCCDSVTTKKPQYCGNNCYCKNTTHSAYTNPADGNSACE